MDNMKNYVDTFYQNIEEEEKWKQQWEYQQKLKIAKQLSEFCSYTIDLFNNNIISRETVVRLFGDEKKVKELEIMQVFGGASYKNPENNNVTCYCMFPVASILEQLDKWLANHKDWAE